MTTKKRIVDSSISFKPGISFDQLRNLGKANPQGFIEKITKMIDEGNLSFSDIRDFREFARYTVDLAVPIHAIDPLGDKRAIMSSAFPVITGSLAIAEINRAAEAVPTIGQYLVTEMEDSKKVTTVVNIDTLDKKIDEVKELKDFPEIGTEESSVEIRHKKNGRIVKISWEMINENEIANIISRFNGVGQIAEEWIEEQTLDRVCDRYGSADSPAEPYVYRPNGTGTTLYSSTANTPGTLAPSGTRYDSNALVDETDLNNTRQRLNAMLNSHGRRVSIPWSSCQFVVPDALVDTMLKIANSELVPGVVNEYSSFGPRGKFRIPIENIISSPKLDDISTSAWYVGDFKSQFKRKWKMRFDYVTLAGTNTQAYLSSQVAFQARIAWDVEVGAVTYNRVVQNLSGTSF